MANIDVQPGTTEQRTFQLERADAEEVGEALKELLGLNDAETGTGAPSNRGQQQTRPQQTPPLPMAERFPLQPQASHLRKWERPWKLTGDKVGSAPAPRIFPVLRTNRILVIAHAVRYGQDRASRPGTGCSG